MDPNAKSFDNLAFNKEDLSGSDLGDREFAGCAFKACDLSGAKLSGSVFIDCVFSECNLSNVRVADCGFQKVRFENSKLLGSEFSTISPLLLEWEFEGCAIALCNFGDLDIRKTRFIDCDVHDTDFIRTDLRGSCFSGSSLKGSRFQESDLEKADFSGAREYYIDPTINRMKGARFSAPEALALLAGFGIIIE